MRWVVLLRAVNLGARNKVPMAKLRSLLEEAGYGDVRTYIASGNVLLDGPRSKAAVARKLERLIADLLNLARLRQRRFDIHPETVDLAEIDRYLEGLNKL